MNNHVLSYGKQSETEGWKTTNQYGDDIIKDIYDSQGGRSENPKTAIPSPFAQLNLVENAFMHLSDTQKLKQEKNGEKVVASTMDERLVSYAWDIGQLFFNFAEKQEDLKIIPWGIDNVKALRREPEHKLFGDTLSMFMEQDAEGYNFNKMNNIYILVHKGQVIGCTSPVSLFMATPNAGPGLDIPVEEGCKLFGKYRSLYERDPKFVIYIYRLFSANPLLWRPLSAVQKYLYRCLKILGHDNQKLYDEIRKKINSFSIQPEDEAKKLSNDIDIEYERIENVEILKCPIHQLKSTDKAAMIKNSDFVIKPTVTIEKDIKLPLILQNNLNAPIADPFIYINNIWDDKLDHFTTEDYAVKPEERKLPQANYKYPWLTTDDFLQPTMVMIEGPENMVFNYLTFYENVSHANGLKKAGFLMPLKPVFFDYFKIEDLKDRIFLGRKKMIEINHNISDDLNVATVTLRIPVQKDRFITLQKVYKENAIYNSDTDIGTLKIIPFSLSIFPFLPHTSHQVMLIDRAIEEGNYYNAELNFFCNEEKNPIEVDDICKRSLKEERNLSTTFYNVPKDFDYICVNFHAKNSDNSEPEIRGIIYPQWPNYIEGNAKFTFAVDFGTTNTHVEYMKDDESPKPLTIAPDQSGRLAATLYQNDDATYDSYQGQEFLPKEIGRDYSFPQRTVLSESEHFKADAGKVVALGDANIPFVYEKGTVGAKNRVATNLKWSTDIAASNRIEAYMKELALLMRTKALQEQGNLKDTTLIWFYPLSMKIATINIMQQRWKKVFNEVFGVNETENNIIKMPESIAPYMFFKRDPGKFKGANSTVASVDIGGGTSDIVIIEPGHEIPTIAASFRFAANSIFGDAYSDIPQGKNNPMIIKYVDYFKKLFLNDDERYGDLLGVLNNIKGRNHSEDINTFLFSIINNNVAQGNNVFNYNLLLCEDQWRKVIFVYFYATLIYYVTSVMKYKKLEMPRQIMFSGTGSKVLNIVGDKNELDMFTKALIEEIYGKSYQNDDFSTLMEEKEPKQVTCRGALLQIRNEEGIKLIKQINNKIDYGYGDDDNSIKVNYSMISKDQLTYGDMNDPSIRKEIIDAVVKWNNTFIQFFEKNHLSDRFGVSLKSWSMFKEYVNKDLDHYLAEAWTYVNKNQGQTDTDKIEDTVFFYPIVGSIRYNLISNLTDQEKINS
jgi:hypothetical protein